MNRSESKYLNTAHLMDEALLSLLVKKKYEFITVKELCEKAGVNRSTFYLHYEGMNDLLAESLEYTMGKLRERFRDDIKIENKIIAKSPIEKLHIVSPQYLVPYLDFVSENRPLFDAVMSQHTVFHTRDSFRKMYEEILSPILSKMGLSDAEKAYRAVYTLNGMFFAILEWVRGGCKESVNQMAGIIVDCVESRFPDRAGVDI